LIDFAENGDAREFGSWVVRYRRMEDVYAFDNSDTVYLIEMEALTHASLPIGRSRHVFVALGDQHIDVLLVQLQRVAAEKEL
jgi:hypothetical protein